MPHYWSFPHEEQDFAACKGGKMRLPGESECRREFLRAIAEAFAYAKAQLDHCGAEDSRCVHQQLTARQRVRVLDFLYIPATEAEDLGMSARRCMKVLSAPHEEKSMQRLRRGYRRRQIDCLVLPKELRSLPIPRQLLRWPN
jgi:hypothetical protein